MIVVYVSWNTSCNFFFFFSFLYSFIPIGCHLLFYHLIYYFTVILYLYYSSTVHVRGFNLPKFYWKSLFLFYFFLFVGIHVRRSFSFCRNIRISLNIGVLMLNSLFLTENLFMLPSFLEGIFIWYTIINCSYFFFQDSGDIIALSSDFLLCSHWEISSQFNISSVESNLLFSLPLPLFYFFVFF